MNLFNGTYLQDGKYRIIHTLGQGGFGVTYEAEQVALHRRVAIKEFFMKEYCDRDSTTSHVTLGTSEGSKELVERFRAKFIREAQMIAGFDNPHIIRIHDIFEENGTAYYVMSYLDGGSLAEKVKKEGPLPEKEAIEYITQVGNALDYIHKHNVLHLDVKPSNILLNSAGEAVLIDFGISKHYDAEGGQTSTTPAGISKGYAPMEQYQQGNIAKFSPATDIYSLGATLYYLLTGEVPPDAAEVYEDGLPEIKANVSVTVKDAIEKAMAPKRKDRPQSIGAFSPLLVPTVIPPRSVDQIKTPKENNPTEESTRLNRPQTSADPQRGEETEYVKSLPQTPEASRVDFEKEQPDTKSKRFAWITLFLLAGLLGILALISHVWSKGDAQTYDTIYIDGVFNKSVSFDSSGGVETYSMEKSFQEAIDYDDLPDWCRIEIGRTDLAIICKSNNSIQSRTAALKLRKWGTSSTLASVFISQAGEAQTIKASSINMQKTGLIEGTAGEQFSIDYTIQPKEAQKHKITWTSSNPSVASISSNGTITAKANGKTTITAKVDGVSATCSVEVRIKGSSSNSSTQASTNSTQNSTPMSISRSSVTIYVGETISLSASNYGPTLRWESEDSSVATVYSGVVTGKKSGVIWIYAIGKETLKCLVTVISKSTNTSSNSTSRSSSTSTSSASTSSNLQSVSTSVTLKANESVAYSVDKWEYFGDESKRIYRISGRTITGLREGTAQAWGYVSGSPKLITINVRGTSSGTSSTSSTGKILHLKVGQSLTAPTVNEGTVQKWEHFGESANYFTISGNTIKGKTAGTAQVWAYINGSPNLYTVIISR